MYSVKSISVVVIIIIIVTIRASSIAESLPGLFCYVNAVLNSSVLYSVLEGTETVQVTPLRRTLASSP